MPMRRFWLGLTLVLTIASAGRVGLLATDAVSFHSDEAVVALMARHILGGDRPVFFYGQAYMGSLDPWLVAIGFATLGESVATIRVVQALLYLTSVALTYALAWRVATERRVAAALIAGALLAIPTPLVATYTTATLGGYNETLVLGLAALHLTLSLTAQDARHRLALALLLGGVVGLGWWTNGAIVAFALPCAAWIAWVGVRRMARALPTTVGVGIVGFAIGSLPWWVFNFDNDWAALRFYLGGADDGGFAGVATAAVPLVERVVSLFLFGLPALIGARFPWSPTFFLTAIGVIVAALTLIALWAWARGALRVSAGGRFLLLAMIGVYIGVYVASRFSNDPTGRYFLPLIVPLVVIVGVAIAHLRSPWAALLAALVIGYQAAGTITAARTPPGITTQFNVAESHIPNDNDADLITFFEARGLGGGYSDYWVAFRFAFLSGEQIVFDPVLPYKNDLSYTPRDRRYLPHGAAVAALPDAAFAVVTALVEPVRAALEADWAAAGITYRTDQVGDFTIFWAFSQRPPLPAFAP